MQIKTNVPLAPYTTFQIGGPARLFCSVRSEAEVIEAAKFAKSNALPAFVLGMGSNLLVSDAGYPGLVIKMEIKGHEFDGEILSVAAGEIWDEIVDESVKRGLHGIENLSAIPGTVGAAPVQNIGAYGSEIKDTLVSVRALDTESMKFVELTNAECKFDYRDSIFKHEKGKYIITRVTLKLVKNGAVNTSYMDLDKYFKEKAATSGGGIDSSSLALTPKDVRDAVIEIRRKKLPDWTMWGTAGSFFKNPVVSSKQYSDLASRYPGLPGFPTSDGRVKIPLGWILDKVCHVKEISGGENSHVRTYEKQALVLVATPGATSDEVITLAHKIMGVVKEKTGIDIEGEVEWVC